MSEGTYSARPDVELAPVDDGAILFNPATTKFLVLNRSASFIWGELASPVGEEDLATKLCSSFPDVTLDAAKSDIRDALAQMVELGVVDVNNQEK